MNISKCGIINPIRIELVTCYEGHILLWSQDIMNISQCAMISPIKAGIVTYFSGNVICYSVIY